MCLAEFLAAGAAFWYDRRSFEVSIETKADAYEASFYWRKNCYEEERT